MKLSKNKKIIYSVLIVALILLLLYKIPTLARYKTRVNSSGDVWSGMVASSYRSGTGTSNNPYIISNGDELAFFSSQLENNNYEGKYFKISNDILLNGGSFKYENDTLVYILNGNTYYLNGNDYYASSDFSGEKVGTLNSFPSLKNFKGTLDGDYHVIYGYYSDKALFKNLNGNVSSLYIENAAVKSSSSASIFADTITDSTIANVAVDGYLISNNYVVGENEPLITDVISNYEELDKSVLGSIAIYAKDSSLVNCINKASIKGGYISSGLVGYSDGTSIINSYNTGNIAAYNSNAIGVFTGSGIVDRVYNSGTINNALIGYVIDSELEINNSFITTNNYLVSYTADSTITGSNNYYTGQDKGTNVTSTQVTTNNLKDKNFLTQFTEFTSIGDLSTNPLNVWLFADGHYPLLYIDDIANNYAELHVNTHTFSSYTPVIKTKKFNTNIVFAITDIDNVHPTDKYYYISNNRTILSKTSLSSVEWEEYSSAVTISDEGFYVIYIKLVDNNSNVSYINSDLLVLDKSGSEITITNGTSNWTALTNGELYADSGFNFSVSATDNLSGIATVQYYLSNQVINDIDTITWTNYTGNININNVGKYKLYVKVVDNCDFVTYASTPLITYDGYTVDNLKPVGFNSGNSITKNSSITFDVNYNNNAQASITHYLVSTMVFPINTNITMIDKTNNKVYGYKISENDTYSLNNGIVKYPLTIFKEKGKVVASNYVESNVQNESFNFTIDFANATINENYNNVNVYLIGESNNVAVRPTITKRSFNILTSSNLELSHSISTNYNNSIAYNSDSITNIAINNIISQNGAYDTKYNDKKIGIMIKLEDNSGNTINKSHLKNIIFSIGDNRYSPGNDNIVRINLNSNTTLNTNLSIITHQCTPLLADGTYYIKITGYSSYDGMYFDNNSLTNTLTIPIVVSRTTNNNYNYSFDVLTNSERIINKGSSAQLSFRILEDSVAHPNIKVSLYRKNQLTAYNQDYTLIDLQDYTETQLDEYIENVYYVTRNAVAYQNGRYNNFNVTLDTQNMNKTSYKLVFDLYDGNIKVESISKYFIVR